MTERRDSLGRRIPDFDRTAAAKKAHQTKREKYGDDYQRRVTSDAGKRRTPGYFGKLKAEGRTAELAELAREGQAKSGAYFKRLKDEGKLDELKSIGEKGRKKRQKKSGDTGVSKRTGGELW